MKRKILNLKKIKQFVLVGMVTLFFNCSPEKEVFLFSYFQDNGQDGLHLAYSEDGLNWEALHDNASFLTPTVGRDKLMRDPCVVYGPDKKFHMVWTVSWGEKGIGYANSSDLLHWSKQRCIPVMEHEPEARNCWAPEIAYDDVTEQYMIYWSTTIPGRFPKTESSGDNGYNHRMYYTTTTNFEEFSPSKLLYDKGFNVIDGTVIKNKGQYVMVLKDETRYPAAKNLRIATSNAFTGPYSIPSNTFTNNQEYWAEGPSIVKHQGKWIVYFDKYNKGTMGAVETSDWKTWKDISSQLSFPEGTRHGTAFKVPERIVLNLKNKEN